MRHRLPVRRICLLRGALRRSNIRCGQRKKISRLRRRLQKIKTSPLSRSLLTTFVMIAGSPRNDFLMSVTPATRYIFAPGKLSTLSPRVRKRGTSEPPRRMTGGFEARAVRQNHLEDDQSVQRHARLLQCHGDERQLALTLAYTSPGGVAPREFPLPPEARVRGDTFSSAELRLRQSASTLPRNDSPPVLFLFHRRFRPGPERGALTM